MSNLVVLVSSVGRRAQLIECFRRSFLRLQLSGKVLGVDCSQTAPGAYLVDQFFQVPPCDVPEFFSVLLNICKNQSVDLLVPTIDTELPFYAEHREDFAAIGTTVAVSTPRVVEICANKALSHKWFLENGFPTVRQATVEDVLSQPSEWTFPLITKPRNGSASIGVRIVSSMDSLRSLCEESNDLVVEEIARGHEHTVNVLVNRDGRCVCAVPHRRLEVRAGEVSKGITVKNTLVMDLVSRVAEKLPGAYGPLNVQGFLSSKGSFVVTEINPRFGGGYPLAHQAGADFPRWLMEELLGVSTSASFDGWQDGLTMLRYDSAVFLLGQELQSVQP
jgi:carbamoyl-phosphate synthase large subunit